MLLKIILFVLAIGVFCGDVPIHPHVPPSRSRMPLRSGSNGLPPRAAKGSKKVDEIHKEGVFPKTPIATKNTVPVVPIIIPPKLLVTTPSHPIIPVKIAVPIATPVKIPTPIATPVKIPTPIATPITTPVKIPTPITSKHGIIPVPSGDRPKSLRNRFVETSTHLTLKDDVEGCAMNSFVGYLWDWYGWIWFTVAGYGEYECSPTLQKKAGLMRMFRSASNSDFKALLYPRLRDYKEGNQLVISTADFNIVKSLIDGITANLAEGDSILFIYNQGVTKLYLNDVEKASTTALTMTSFNNFLRTIHHYLYKTK